jgi:hypothetical protein
MAQLRVDNITNQNDDGPVTFDKGIIASADNLILKPGTVSFSPAQLATNVGATTSIQIGFNQAMQFSGIGTIRIREGSATGTITTSFTCGVSTEANFVGQTLIINPKNDLASGQTYFVTLPPVGIANTVGGFIEPITNYQFQTEFVDFNIQGGDFEQVIVSPTSPTGYYKYNVFTSSGIATFQSPSAAAIDFAYVMVGGGGGGGSARGSYYDPGSGGGGAGGYVKNYNSNNLPAKNYTISIGSGGSGCWNWPTGISGAPPTTPSQGRSPSPAVYTVIPSPGGNSTFGPTPVGTVIAYGGGAGGHGSIRGNQPPSPGDPSQAPYRLQWWDTNVPSSMPQPSHPNWSPAPLPPSPSSSPYPTTNWNDNQLNTGGAPGGSGGGHSISAYYPGYLYDYTYTRINITGCSGASYPSPNQQGYPGGPVYMNGQSSMYGAGSGSGGGGAGGAGGGGGTNTNDLQTPIPPASGGNGKTTPEFPGPGMSLIPGFPTPFVQVLGGNGYLAGGGGGGRYMTGPPSPYPNGPNVGGNGGGGRGYHYHPQTGETPATRGAEHAGGGGGGGKSPGGPTGAYPTPAPGQWLGQNGGSGVMMFRYAHPGS